MALTWRLPLLITMVVAGICLPQVRPVALAAGLAAKEKTILKEAGRLYRQGQYEDAAKLLADLALEHPEMVHLQRNLGACYYYLHRPEPALSNLRGYLAHKKGQISVEDKAEVERWIAEMEQLRMQNIAAPVEPAHDVGDGVQAAPVTSAPNPNAPERVPTAIGGQPHEPPHAKMGQVQQEVPPLHMQVSPDASGEVANPFVPIPAESAQITVRESPAGTPHGGDGKGLRIAGIACGVAGLASISTAIYYYARAKSLSDKVTKANPASPSDFQAGKDAETMQWVFYSVGAGAIATGAVLYLLGHAKSTNTTSLALTPMLGPQSAGISAHGGF